MIPQIISSYDGGKHNEDLTRTLSRLEREGAYKDLSTIVIIPALGTIPTKVAASWWNLFFPPNQKVVKIFATGMEVGAAYSQTIEMILANNELAKFKYILTLEHDNVPPPDGLLKILEKMESNPQFSCIGGLYFTKGEGGVAQIWGNPNEMPLNFKPQLPVPGELVECCGTGMGFNIWRLDVFKDERLRKPWFKTESSIQNGSFSQDLYFWNDARKYGHRCAIDCSVLVGHYDSTTDITW
jgi:hypothetical protein